MVGIKSGKLLVIACRANSRFIPGVVCSCPKPQPVQRGRNLLVAESLRHLPNDSDRFDIRTPSVFAGCVLLYPEFRMAVSRPVNHQDDLADFLIHVDDDLVNENAYQPLFQSHVGDRKSTRLNSSHLVISYAVFCLKKKKVKSTAVVLTPS